MKSQSNFLILIQFREELCIEQVLRALRLLFLSILIIFLWIIVEIW